MNSKLTNKDRYNAQRQKQAEERKLMVLDVAQELFLKNGLSNTSMNDIMKTAQVSKATLYRYFDNINIIAFEIEYRMLKNIFSNIKVDGDTDEEKVCKLLLILIDEFHKHEPAHRYIGMFDNLYSKTYPNEQYLDEYNKVIDDIFGGNKHSTGQIPNKFITSINVVFSFLQRLALRGELLHKQQGITVDEQLYEFRKMIEREFGITTD